MACIFINFLHYRGFVDQVPIMSDSNSILKYKDVSEIKDYLPNVTATTIPIYENKLLYFVASSKNLNVDSLINKLLKYTSPNPYLGIKDRILADLYLKKGNSDSARFHFKNAFLKLPNNRIYNTNYFNMLAANKDSIGLKEAFKKVSRPHKITYKNYINNYMQLYGYNDNYLNRLVDSLKNVFPEDQEIIDLRIMNKIGIPFYEQSQLEEGIAMNYFEKSNFKQAIYHFEKSKELNPYDAVVFENLAISYMKQKNLDKAKINFKIVIDSFEFKTGKSEFYYGVLNLENDKKQACKYLKISNKLKFSGAKDFVIKYCEN